MHESEQTLSEERLALAVVEMQLRETCAASLAYVTGASNYHAFESDPVPLPAYQVNPQGVSDRERGFDDFGA